MFLLLVVAPPSADATQVPSTETVTQPPVLPDDPASTEATTASSAPSVPEPGTAEPASLERDTAEPGAGDPVPPQAQPAAMGLPPQPPETQPEPGLNDALDESAPAATKDRPDFERSGVFASASIGIANCPQTSCSLIKMGAHGRFELGYRIGYVTPILALSIGGSSIDIGDVLPKDTPSDVMVRASGSLRLFEAGAGVQVSPIATGRIDPFFVAVLGYSRVTDRFSVEDSTAKRTVERGKMRLGGGLGIYVARHVALAPRFDITLPFGGRVCTEATGELVDPAGEGCNPVKRLVEEQESKVEERAFKKSLPRPWSVAVDLRIVF